MSRIALTRLLVANDRSARRRLAGIVAGVMVGVALFLMLLAAAQAFPERSMRSSWGSTALMPGLSQQSNHTDLQPDHVLTDNELAVASNVDIVGSRPITLLRVALPESGTTSVRIPGADVVPKRGEYLASPALAKRISSLPADQLGDRYGKQAGVLAPEAVEGPDSLVAVVGTDLGTVAASDFYIPPQVVTSFQGIPYENEAYRIATIVGAIAVLVPALLLVGIVTDLGAAQRAERFATLRLIGATPQQVARTAALEIGATTFVGALAGVALYLAMIPVAAQITLRSSRFYYSDLLRSPVNAVLAVVVTTAGAAAVAWWRTRRADLGPLGGSRERTERRPRLISLVPVILGTAGLVSTPAVARQDSDLTIYLLPASFLCAMLGLLWAGPVLTWWVAQGGRALTHSAAQVIGFNRITQHPRAVFRAVAGVVIAVYAMTVFAVAITAAARTRDVTQGGGHRPGQPRSSRAGPHRSGHLRPGPGYLPDLTQLDSGPRGQCHGEPIRPARLHRHPHRRGHLRGLARGLDGGGAAGAPAGPRPAATGRHAGGNAALHGLLRDGAADGHRPGHEHRAELADRVVTDRWGIRAPYQLAQQRLLVGAGGVPGAGGGGDPGQRPLRQADAGRHHRPIRVVAVHSVHIGDKGRDQPQSRKRKPHDSAVPFGGVMASELLCHRFGHESLRHVRAPGRTTPGARSRSAIEHVHDRRTDRHGRRLLHRSLPEAAGPRGTGPRSPA